MHPSNTAKFFFNACLNYAKHRMYSHIYACVTTVTFHACGPV